MNKDVLDLTAKTIDYSDIPDLSEVSMDVSARFAPQHDGQDAVRFDAVLAQLRDRAKKRL